MFTGYTNGRAKLHDNSYDFCFLPTTCRSKDRNISVVDQGMAYLNLMLNNKADFILEYNDKFAGSNTLRRTDVDWSQSRVLFVAPEFTKYQQYAIGFKDFGIQLWEIRKYKTA